MDTGNSWWYFTKALTPEQCQDIVDLGEIVVAARGKKKVRLMVGKMTELISLY